MASNLSTSASNEKYHTVAIRSDLPTIPKDYKKQLPKQLPPGDFWIDEVKRSNKAPTDRHNFFFWKRKPTAQKAKYKLLYAKANGPYTHTGGNHSVLKAFLTAYNSHEDVILSPDDIWLLVCRAFAEYVNDNSEKLRHLFVDHQDKKTLTIIDVGVSVPDWEGFLERMRLEIAIMTTFKNYFDYEYEMDNCGIRNIHFLGTLDDWKLLREKTSQLQSFTTPKDKFSTYITGLLPILDQFIETYQGKVDNKFWDTIFDLEHIGDESGMRPGTHINGWFLRLCYGQHNDGSCHMADIKVNSLVVPVKVNNKYTNESKMCYFAGGFHGIESRDSMHKPVMSLAIIEDSASIKPWKE